MKLEFANSDIKSYSHGNLLFVNDGSEINVSAATGGDLLQAETFINATESVKVFREVKEAPKDQEAESVTDEVVIDESIAEKEAEEEAPKSRKRRNS
jgi:hypothetical protein